MRILTWNARGSRDAKKSAELRRVLQYWEFKDPIEIVCLQEVAVTQDRFEPFLQGLGFTCQTYREGWNDTGSNQMIAVRSDVGIKIDGWGRLRDVEVFDNVRIPMYCEITIGDTKGIVFNYHAEAYSVCAGGATWAMLEAVNDGIREYWATGKYEFVILAGDLNVNSINAVQRLFGLRGYYNRLDYILGSGIKVQDAQHHLYSSSDHMPMAAHLTF